MAIMKGTKKSIVSEINADGVTTQLELENAISDHISTHHTGSLPTGWKDNVVSLNAMNMGDPSYSPIFADSGNGIWGLCFSDDNTNYAYCDFHINHDYKIGSKIYPHIHWMPLSHSTGKVKWVFEYIFAKGHGQNESLTDATTTFSILQAGKGLVGEHMVCECSDEQTFIVSEPDTIVRLKVYRDGASPDDTFYGSVVGLMMDFHYQSDRETTPNKSPDFYIVSVKFVIGTHQIGNNIVIGEEDI